MVVSPGRVGMRAAALVALMTAAVIAGCGDDEADPDGGPSDPDAGLDAAPFDADVDDLCPGQLTFEALIADLLTGTPVFEMTLREDVADGAASTTSAPNGRAVLCLDPSITNQQLRAEKADYLSRVDRLSAEAHAIYSATAEPYPLDVVTSAAADALLDDLGVTRDPADALVVVSVRTYPGGEPLLGAQVALDMPHDGAFARDARGAFAAGDEIAAGGAILFANVRLEGGPAAITATVVPPDGFRGTCDGPPLVGFEPDGMGGVHFACH